MVDEVVRFCICFVGQAHSQAGELDTGFRWQTSRRIQSFDYEQLEEQNGQELVGKTSWTQWYSLFLFSRGPIGTSLYTFSIFWFPNRMTFPQTSQLSRVSLPHPAPFFQKAKVSYLLCKCLLVTVTATVSPSTHTGKSLGTQAAHDWCVHVLRLRFIPWSLCCPHLSHILHSSLYQQ